MSICSRLLPDAIIYKNYVNIQLVYTSIFVVGTNLFILRFVCICGRHDFPPISVVIGYHITTSIIINNETLIVVVVCTKANRLFNWVKSSTYFERFTRRRIILDPRGVY